MESRVARRAPERREKESRGGTGRRGRRFQRAEITARRLRWWRCDRPPLPTANNLRHYRRAP
ncbi:hypothetical protein GQ55_3G098900 [Panicum hallii var. hallii]|uniref:Uncharacterized protein n=1 Tax=Panicum hallii var. hallii TaxID=1504633 RepID=A0A2T7E7N4_9POAL|nr:hypothetical protein GQ55_3G098900 [Panicum hallii var. hallii]